MVIDRGRVKANRMICIDAVVVSRVVSVQGRAGAEISSKEVRTADRAEAAPAVHLQRRSRKKPHRRMEQQLIWKNFWWNGWGGISSS